LCDKYDEWEIISGNSDALCNEDSRDPYCSICDKKNGSCEFSNYPYFDEDEDLHYYNIIDYRESIRNKDRCKDCVYNDEYGWLELNQQEQRKHKILKITKNLVK
jgi:hypothetical protein